MRKSQSSNSNSRSHMDSPHSPTKFHSPLRSNLTDPPDTPPYTSPQTSPTASPEKLHDFSNAIVALPAKSIPSPVVVEAPPAMTKVSPAAAADGGLGHGGERLSSRSGGSVRRKLGKEEVLSKVGLGFRVCEVILCLISFSVMAADQTQGWSGDAFYRYREYRYCLSVNVIAFVHAGFQAFDLATHLITGKHLIAHHLRCYFNFFMDQILAYLLISAGSAAATRLDDWQSNWGKDEFTEMTTVSVAMSFLAFAAFSISSLISGYNLCTCD